MRVMNYYVSVWVFLGGGGGGLPCQNIQASGCHRLTSSTTTTREKMGQRFTTSAAADMQAPYAEHFPPIRSRRRTRRSPARRVCFVAGPLAGESRKTHPQRDHNKREERQRTSTTRPLKKNKRQRENRRHGGAGDRNLLLATVNFTPGDNATPKINEVCTPAVQFIGP